MRSKPETVVVQNRQFIATNVGACLSGGGPQQSGEHGAVGQAGRHQPVRDGLRRTSRRHRLRSGDRPRRTRLPRPPALHHDHNRRRLLHQHRPGRYLRVATSSLVHIDVRARARPAVL